MNLLLVDDQPNIIASLVSCIPWHSLGIPKVLTASSAAGAREILGNQSVDIVISDIEMPGEDGLGLLAWIREQGMDLECIFLTAHADFFYAKRAISLNVSEFIIQPARDEDLIRAVKKAVANRNTASKNAELMRYQGQDFTVKNAAIASIFTDWPGYPQIVMDPERLDAQICRLQRLHTPCSPESSVTLLYCHLRTWHKIPLTPVALFTKYRSLLDAELDARSVGHLTWFINDNAFFTLIFSPMTERMLQHLRVVYDSMEPQSGCAVRMLCCSTDLKHIQEAISTLRSEEIRFGLANNSDSVCFLSVKVKLNYLESDPTEEYNKQLLVQIKKM